MLMSVWQSVRNRFVHWSLQPKFLAATELCICGCQSGGLSETDLYTGVCSRNFYLRQSSVYADVSLVVCRKQICTLEFAAKIFICVRALYTLMSVWYSVGKYLTGVEKSDYDLSGLDLNLFVQYHSYLKQFGNFFNVGIDVFMACWTESINHRFILNGLSSFIH